MVAFVRSCLPNTWFLSETVTGTVSLIQSNYKSEQKAIFQWHNVIFNGWFQNLICIIQFVNNESTKSNVSISIDFNEPYAGDPNSPGEGFVFIYFLTINDNSEFHKILRGCRYEHVHDADVKCMKDWETEDLEIQIPPAYRVEDGYLQSVCRNVMVLCTFY